MKLEEIAKRVDEGNARAFVQAARHLINAMMVETARQADSQGPAAGAGARDYRTAELSREAAPGGWISRAELDRTNQQLIEAIAAEKWIEGVVAAVRVMAMFK